MKACKFYSIASTVSWRQSSLRLGIYRLFQGPDIVETIKISRLRSFAHVIRMHEDDPTRKHCCADPSNKTKNKILDTDFIFNNQWNKNSNVLYSTFMTSTCRQFLQFVTPCTQRIMNYSSLTVWPNPVLPAEKSLRTDDICTQSDSSVYT